MANPINVLFSEGQTNGAGFEFYYNELRPHLLKYAAAVCKSVLRRVDEHLVTEMVDDLLMDLASFRGRSLFSSWAHARFQYRCIDEIRYQSKNLGESLEDIEIRLEPDFVKKVGLLQFQDRLSAPQRVVLQARVEGYTLPEIALQMSIGLRTTERLWSQVVEKTREE